jgi:hypothetical protein
MACIVFSIQWQRVWYSLTTALKAIQAFPAVGERTYQGDAVQRCEDTDARTLEVEIAALIREAGDSLRGPPTESPQATQATWISGGASEFERLPTDHIGITVPTASGWDHRSGTAGRGDDLRFRLILTIGVLLAALAFAWMGSNRFFSSSPSHGPLTSSSAPHLGSEHENSRPATRGDVAPNTTGMQQNVITSTILKPGRGQQSPHVAAQPAAAPANSVSKVARQNSTGPLEAAAQQRAKTPHEPRPAPIPETRPTTIPGWMIREVIGGTVVLEGPNGPVKVTLGNTVPGLGKIESIVRWGSRWIVATSRGLITTQ